ncbi:hypothetical protein B0H14DRAFT_2521377 [Mycena olivaceomarginata]|nr:hypothetical protein B0H14DRAFT_2521377 [Mycena olivaceomarginata]
MPDFSSDRFLPFVPDNLTVPQFFLDQTHEMRPTRPKATPWLIADQSEPESGLELTAIRAMTVNLATGLHAQFGIGEDDVVLIFSTNHIDYLICIWAVHRLCAIISPCNPMSTVAELSRQLVQTKASLLIAHERLLGVALASAREIGIPPDRVVVIGGTGKAPHMTIANLTNRGLHQAPYSGRQIGPGEGATKIALLCPSSGTTGLPKIVAISHFAVIANVLQIAAQNRVNEEYTSWRERRYRPGDVCLAIHFVLFSGMTLVVVPKFSLRGMLESIVRHKIAQLMLVPPQVVLLCKEPTVHDYDLFSVRVILCAAAPLSADINERLINLFPDAHIGQAYGEFSVMVRSQTMWPTRSKRGANGGELVPGVSARLIKSDGTLADYNEPGELYLKTPAAALRYLDNEEGTKETFVDGYRSAPLLASPPPTRTRTGDLCAARRARQPRVLLHAWRLAQPRARRAWGVDEP